MLGLPVGRATRGRLAQLTLLLLTVVPSVAAAEPEWRQIKLAREGSQASYDYSSVRQDGPIVTVRLRYPLPDAREAHIPYRIDCIDLSWVKSGATEYRRDGRAMAEGAVYSAPIQDEAAVEAVALLLCVRDQHGRFIQTGPSRPRRAYLGAVTIPMTPALQADFGVVEGSGKLADGIGEIVTQIDEGGPAQRGGLAVGDIIVRVNHFNVVSIRKPLTFYISSLMSGHLVMLEVVREGKMKNIETTLVDRPPDLPDFGATIPAHTSREVAPATLASPNWAVNMLGDERSALLEARGPGLVPTFAADLQVSATGAVTGCSLKQSSGTADIDTLFCRRARGARFRPPPTRAVVLSRLRIS